MFGREYGLLAGGDPGTLTFQGTRYKGFAAPPPSPRALAVVPAA